MTSTSALASRLRLALVCAALALGGGAFPAHAVASAPQPAEVVLVRQAPPSAPRPPRARAPRPPAARSLHLRPRVNVLAAPARAPAGGPRPYVLHRALLR